MSPQVENAIRQAKAERDALLSRDYVPREGTDAFRKALESGLVAVVTGPRRAGKSVFCLLGLRGQDFAYVNFDDEQLAGLGDTDALVEGLTAVYGPTRLCFFDEIQNLPRWELFVNKLHRRGYRLVLTGSNAKLLSREAATTLTGRYLLTEVLPFGFREYLAAKGGAASAGTVATPEERGVLRNLLAGYLSGGGFPEVVTRQLDAPAYLRTLFDAVLLKDVVTRQRIRFPHLLRHLALFLASNPGSLYTLSSLRRSLQFSSTLTVQNYVGYLEEAYVALSLNRFSPRVREQVRAPRKAYAVDTGYANACGFRTSPDTGRLLENAVFLECVRRGYVPSRDLFHYRTASGREVDLVLCQGLAVEALVQVCHDASAAATLKRETQALVQARGEVGHGEMVLITGTGQVREPLPDPAIRVVPAWQWLCER
jgi:predicted AAA+ superfamily ATPase